MALPYLDRIPTSLQADFESGVRAMATRLGVKPEWIVLSMYRESGLNPKAVNKSSKATGLIQWMPNTALDLGTSQAALLKMNALQQLPYVEKYLRVTINRIRVQPVRLVDLYLVILYPAAVGKPDNYIIFKRGTTAYRQNSSINPYGNVTVGDVSKFINSIVPSVWQEAAESPGLAVGGLLVGAGLAYVTYSQFFSKKQRA